MNKLLSAAVLSAFIFSTRSTVVLAGESMTAASKSSKQKIRALEAEVRSLNDQITKIRAAAQEAINALEADNHSLRDELERIRSAVGNNGPHPN